MQEPVVSHGACDGRSSVQEPAHALVIETSNGSSVSKAIEEFRLDRRHMPAVTVVGRNAATGIDVEFRVAEQMVNRGTSA